MTKQEVLTKFELPDAFDGFEPDPKSVLWGWHGDLPIFEELIGTGRPKLIIEVGAWMGQSTITMARALKQYVPDSSIITIDTWLGSQEHWIELDGRQYLELVHGYPTFYKRFMSNVVMAGCSDVIVPFPNTSAIAARILATQAVRANLIYIDGSHDEKDVYEDLVAYWELLAQGGIIFGDDWQWPSVASAVTRFCSERGLAYRIDTVNWIISKA